MRFPKLGRLTFALGVILLLGLAFAAGLTDASPTLLYVAPAGTGCGGRHPCYSSIQAAVDAAPTGAEIRVAEGTYTDLHAREHAQVETRGTLTAVVHLHKSLTLRGGYSLPDWEQAPATYPTVLDAQLKGGLVLSIVGEVSPTVEGLQMTGGLGGQPGGGAVFVWKAAPILRYNYVYSNAGGLGAGLYLEESAARILHNTFSSNYALVGGALYSTHSEATIGSNTFTGNHAYIGAGIGLEEDCSTVHGNAIISNTTNEGGRGGGISVSGGSPQMVSNRIAHNHSVFGGSDGVEERGGGVLIMENANVLFAYNKVYSNTARWCGGIEIDESSAHFTQNTISQNHAEDGGGICVRSGAYLTSDRDHILENYGSWASGAVVGPSSSAYFTNTLIARNVAGDPGGGLIIGADSHVQLLHGTLVSNTGGSGIYAGGTRSSLHLTNTLIASHTVGIDVVQPVTLSLNGVLWAGTPVTLSAVPGTSLSITHSYTGTAAFANPRAGDYHLRPESDARDRGITTSLAKDFEGEPRANALPDLGYDEYWAPGSPGALKRVYFPLIQGGAHRPGYDFLGD